MIFFHNCLKNVNISWFNIVVLKLFSDKKLLDDENIQCTHHVENCIHACAFYKNVHLM